MGPPILCLGVIAWQILSGHFLFESRFDSTQKKPIENLPALWCLRKSLPNIQNNMEKVL